MPTPKFGHITVQEAVFVNLKQRKWKSLAKIKQFEDDKMISLDWFLN